MKNAGVSGVNISIDSLNSDLHKEITRGGDLGSCLARALRQVVLV